MNKSTRSRGKAEKWIEGSNFLFGNTTESKRNKTDRRLTMTPKKTLSQGRTKNRRTSNILKRLKTDKSPVNVIAGRTRRQSMVHLKKVDKKTISRATSEKNVLPINKKFISVQISPLVNELKAKAVKKMKTPIKSRAADSSKSRNESISKITSITQEKKSITPLVKAESKAKAVKKTNPPVKSKAVESSKIRRESMSKITNITPEKKSVRKSSRKGAKEQPAELLESIVSTNLVIAKKGKRQPPLAKKSPQKPASAKKMTAGKKSGRTPVSMRKTPVSKKVAATPPEINAVEVQLAIANAVSISGRNKVKRLGARSPPVNTRSLRSSRKVKITVKSPLGTGKFRKTPANRASAYLDNGSSPILSVKRRDTKPFTPKPDNPYDIMKNNMRKRITSRLELMDISPERGPPSPSSFSSLASTPSSSWNLPPTPKSSRMMQDSFIRSEKRSIRNYRKDITPMSSTPKKGSAPRNNSTYLSFNESKDSSVELSCTDSPSASPAVDSIEPVHQEKSSTKRGYCNVM